MNSQSQNVMEFNRIRFRSLLASLVGEQIILLVPDPNVPKEKRNVSNLLKLSTGKIERLNVNFLAIREGSGNLVKIEYGSILRLCFDTEPGYLTIELTVKIIG